MSDAMVETVTDIGTETCPLCSNPISFGEVVIRQAQATIHDDCRTTEEDFRS